MLKPLLITLMFMFSTTCIAQDIWINAASGDTLYTLQDTSGVLAAWIIKTPATVTVEDRNLGSYQVPLQTWNYLTKTLGINDRQNLLAILLLFNPYLNPTP